MFHLNESFSSGDERLRALLAAHADEPQGYVPQHHLAHVVVRPEYRRGVRVEREA